MSKKIEVGNFVPAMEEDGACPYCGGPTVNVGLEYITCGEAMNRDCFGKLVRTPVHQLPGHEETMSGLRSLTLSSPQRNPTT